MRSVGGIPEAHVAQRQRRRSRATRNDAGDRASDAREMAGAERRARRFALDGERGREQRREARVRRGAALDRVDQLRDAMPAVDEAQEQLEVRDERPDRHRAGDDPLAALPHDHEHAGGHEQRVDGLETALQPDHAQVALGERPGQHGDALHDGAETAEHSQHANPGQRLLERRRQVGVRLARPGRARRHPPAGGVSQDHRERHGRQGQHGEDGIEDQHRDHEREREQHGIPRLDGELAHADAQHFDVADDASHQIPDRRALLIGHGPPEHAAEGVRAEVGADPRVRGHQPPALDDARDLGEQRACDEGERGPADVAGCRFASLESQRPIDGAAEQDRGQHDRGVHDDAGDRAEHQLARDLAEIAPQLPEIRQPSPSYGRSSGSGRSECPCR